jgi:hypothetical protein
LEVNVRRSPGVFNTDQVNRDRMRCPASELMKAEEHHQRACQSRGRQPGLPVHMQHDMHRLIGWTRPLGLYADSLMVRVLGLVEEPETEQEVAELKARADEYWDVHHRDGCASYQNELRTRVAPADLTDARFLQMEAAVVARVGVAAELYPDLFKPGVGSVDKDGLTDYREVLRRMKQVQPGVFHDTDRNLLLFAHKFFRRSLSHRNKLNAYFLQSFSAAAEENGDLRVRLRLDPDLVGHPASARNLIELEYWRGPLYNDDIAAIPEGVAEHKADDRTREYEGVDRTQVWWKAPESRRVAGGEVAEYRTFEVEELIEDPSGGLGDDRFGCRYAHAEFSADESAITHFDGAIRAYAAEAYLDRIDADISRAGKQASYTKLFRFDGTLPIPYWKRLLSDFFRGNKLIPEYLGAPENVDEEAMAESQTDASHTAPIETGAMALAALISLEPGSIDDPLQVCSEYFQEIAGQLIPYVEIGLGEVASHFRTHLNPDDITLVGFTDRILNLARIRFGRSDHLKTTFDTEIGALARALRRDVDAGVTHRAAIPFTWEHKGLLVTLTIAGDAEKVATILEQLHTVIDPTKPPSEWIEPVSDLIKATTPRQRSEVNWSGVQHGILSIKRSGTVGQQMLMPDAIKQLVLPTGPPTP